MFMYYILVMKCYPDFILPSLMLATSAIHVWHIPSVDILFALTVHALLAVQKLMTFPVSLPIPAVHLNRKMQSKAWQTYMAQSTCTCTCTCNVNVVDKGKVSADIISSIKIFFFFLLELKIISLAFKFCMLVDAMLGKHCTRIWLSLAKVMGA